jgi:hypothetical protein
MAITQQMLKDAWADKDLKDWIQKTFTIGENAANALPLYDYQTTIPDLGLCAALTRSAGAIWKNKGDTRLELSGLKVSRFEGAVSKEPSFPDATTANLPIDFSTLEAKGRYALHYTCTCSNMFGMEITSSNSTQSGNLTGTFGAGSIIYIADFGGGALRLKSISIPGTPAVSVTTDGMPDWLSKIANVLSGRDFLGLISDRVGNAFANAAFARTMIDTLNKHMGL